MNIFNKIVAAEHAGDTRLGAPSADKTARLRRLHVMSTMTGGNGFTMPAKSVRTFSDGTTRGQRKRAARSAAMARVSELREPEFMHSAARRRDSHDAMPRPMTGFPMQEAA